MKENQLGTLLALHRGLNVTPTRFERLKKHFKEDWGAAFGAKTGELLDANMEPKAVEKFLDMRDKLSPEEELKRLEVCGAHVVFQEDKEYPSALKDIHSPPVMLFVRGQIEESDFPSISVVGSRNITHYGKRAIELIVGEIADQGVTIVSGLALGADTVAHKTAYEHCSRTLCVLGNGIDQIYPRTHAGFAEKLLAEERGAIISEYLPGVEPRPENFPVRNRIVAGMSKATIVIEAAEDSGSLITATMAVDEGREVFALPGEVFNGNSIGCNQLIWKGQAHPALSGTQVLEQLGMQQAAIKQKAKKNIPTTGVEAEILKLFTPEPKRHINDLMRESGLENSVVVATLSLMEIKGLISDAGNQMYVKNV